MKVRGRTWHYTLEPALDATGLVIRWEQMGKQKILHSFCTFTDYLQFWDFYGQTPAYLRSFNEVALESQEQKLRFDIDMPGIVDEAVGIAVISDLVYNLGSLLAELGIALDLSRDLILFSSSGYDNGKYKQSYHLILDNYACMDSIEVRHLTERILAGLEQKHLQYLDASVADANHSLRIYGSHKPGSLRVKNPLNQWYYGQTLVTRQWQVGNVDAVILQASLLTVTHHCKILPAQQQHISNKIEENAPENVLENLEQWLRQLDLTGKVKFVKIEGRKILLRNIRGYHCPNCLKSEPHTSENPYLYLGQGGVYFNCRRNSKSLRISGAVEVNSDINMVNDAVSQQKETLAPGTISLPGSRIMAAPTMLIQDAIALHAGLEYQNLYL